MRHLTMAELEAGVDEVRRSPRDQGVLEMIVFCFFFLWFRATFPRYPYDQIMRLGWKVLIPVTIVWIGVEGVMAALEIGPWAQA